jgi:hypothetical protein
MHNLAKPFLFCIVCPNARVRRRTSLLAIINEHHHVSMLVQLRFPTSNLGWQVFYKTTEGPLKYKTRLSRHSSLIATKMPTSAIAGIVVNTSGLGCVCQFIPELKNSNSSLCSYFSVSTTNIQFYRSLRSVRCKVVPTSSHLDCVLVISSTAAPLKSETEANLRTAKSFASQQPPFLGTSIPRRPRTRK